MPGRDKVGTFEKPLYSAVSLRAPLRGEIQPITVTTTSKRFAVPEEWKGSYVHVEADGGDLYLQVATDGNAVADKDARSTEGGSPIALTAPANGCVKVPDGQFREVPFPQNASTFALQGSAACCARCHLAET